MTRSNCVAGLAIVIAVAFSLPAIGHDWTDTTGKFHVSGELVSNSAGVVCIKTADGRTLAVSIDRLSKGDQDFVRHAAKDADAGNPFVAIQPKAPVPKPKPLTIEQAATTRTFVKELFDRLGNGIDKVTNLDTQERRNNAFEKLLADTTGSAKGKTLTFVYSISDIESDGSRSKIDLDWPDGIDPNVSGLHDLEGINQIHVHVSRDDAIKVSKGDRFILSGQASFIYGSRFTSDDSPLQVIMTSSSNPGYWYHLVLRNVTYKIEHAAAAKK